MRKIQILGLSILLASIGSSVKAQGESEFKPSGQVIVRSFFDYSSGLGHKNDEAGFDLTRAFLGYNYKFSPTLQARIVIDGASGRSTDNSLEVYVRNAYINWQDHGFNIHVGEIGLLQFKTQEDYWKHRYVLKSYQDLNKTGHSVDLGTTVQYQFSPKLSADITIVNGEGYKNVSNKNKGVKYGAGATYSFLKNFVFRAYGDVYTEHESTRDKLPTGVESATYKNQYNLALFTGYQDKTVSAGVEYNRIFNKGYIESKDSNGYSAYASGKIAPKWRVFGRYDYTTSSTPDGFSHNWNKQDGQLSIVGIEYQPVKQLKISPNVRNINPSHRQSEQYVYLNMEFNL